MTRRVEKFRPEEMTPEQQVVYETITGGPRKSMPQLFPMTDDEGRLEGPFNAWLINPVLGSALEVMGSAYRDGMGALTRRSREIAILIIAKHYECNFELYAHVRVRRAAEMDEREIGDLVDGVDHHLRRPDRAARRRDDPAPAGGSRSRRRAVRGGRGGPRYRRGVLAGLAGRLVRNARDAAERAAGAVAGRPLDRLVAERPEPDLDRSGRRRSGRRCSGRGMTDRAGHRWSGGEVADVRT